MPQVTMVRAAAWWSCTRPHRCSTPYCREPAVAFKIEHVDGGWRERRGFDRRRYVCATHVALYRITMRRGLWWYRLVAPERLRARKGNDAQPTTPDRMGTAQGRA